MLRESACASILFSTAAVLERTNYAPISWGYSAFCVWLLYLVSRGWTGMHQLDRFMLGWGWTSIAAFNTFALANPEFQGWGDVYFFCGSRLEFCSCDMRWNAAGWLKAIILWNFVLSAAVGLQKLVIQAGLNGLLPGEEVVTKECFISVCWRLIPYCLNNWEKQWGAECSSMMFELPHFAIELLVIMPTVQIMCCRLRILAFPGRNRRPPLHIPAALRQTPEQLATLAPSVMHAAWRPMPQQHRLFPRLRANLRMLLMVVGVLAAAATNAMWTPLRLERHILDHPRAAGIIASARMCSQEEDCWAEQQLQDRLNPFLAKGSGICRDLGHLKGTFLKHGVEMLKMQSAAHTDLVPLAETSLAILRLSCERFFLLISVFVAYLAFNSHVPTWMRRLIRLNHVLSVMFQKCILYSFPAICWMYGAGTVFSTFVSLIFWGAPAKRVFEFLRAYASDVQPVGLKDATAEQVETVNAKCAVCWGEMEAAHAPGLGRLRENGAAKALVCGHAFHEACIHRWVKQCHGQGRSPTCPLCNRSIQMRVRYRMSMAGPHPESSARELREYPMPTATRGRGGRSRPLRRARSMEGSFADQVAPQTSRRSFREAGEATRIRSTVTVTPSFRPTSRLATGTIDPPPAADNPPSAIPSQAGLPWDVSTSQPDVEPAEPSSRLQSTRHMSPEGQRAEAEACSETGGCHAKPPAGGTRPSGADLGWASSSRGWRGAGVSSVAEPPQQGALNERRASSGTASSSHVATSEAGPSSAGLFPTGSGAGAARGSAGQGRGVGSGGQDLAGAVQRDRMRVQAYLEYCKAQEAVTQSKIALGKGVMQESWETANELMANAEELEQMVARGEGGGGSVDTPGLEIQPEESRFEALWQKQQRLWSRSRRLYDENLGHGFTLP